MTLIITTIISIEPISILLTTLYLVTYNLSLVIRIYLIWKEYGRSRGRPVKTASGNLNTEDISITTNPEAQCLKYVDLSVFAAGSYPEAQTAASELRDQQLVTYYTVYDDEVRIGFNALLLLLL